MSAPGASGPEEVRAVLADGRVAAVRALGASDVDAVARLHAGLSEKDRYYRFFGAVSEESLRRFAERFLGGLDAHELMLGAFVSGRLVGVGHFAVLAHAEEAEVAFVVGRDVQARGVATLLLENLAAAARKRGVRRFVAEVLTENTAMLRVFTDSGLRCRTRSDGPVVHVELAVDLDEHYRTRVSDREGVADVASLRYLLSPSSVAVVGASRRSGSIGNALLRNILAGDYRGTCWPVNRNASAVEGLPAFRSVSELPEPPDLAVVCVPAPDVPGVAEECGRRGVRALLVVSAGITSSPDVAHRLLDVVRRWGMRLLGPNCIGLVNSDPEVRLDATFTASGMPTGDVGVMTQSGGVSIAVMEGLASCGLGVSTMVSAGDKYDVSSNDMLLWWERDERTRMGVLYLESFGNPRKFAWLSRRLAHRKPLIVLKSGASPVAQVAAASHTAATATPGTTRDALLEQAGAIGVDGIEELVAVVCLLSWRSLPKGGRVTVVSNAGGLGALTADACARHGLELPELAPATLAELADHLPEQASVRNPVDTTAAISADAFGDCVRIVLRDPGVDSVIVPVVATAIADPLAEAARAAAEGDRGEFGTPVLVVRCGQSQGVRGLLVEGRTVPVFAGPETAARALAEVSGYARWRLLPRGTVPELPGIDVAAARALVSEALVERPGGAWLAPDAAQDLLASFGLPVVPVTICADEAELLAVFRRMGERVVLKAWVEGLLHKSKSGGVVVDIATVGQLRAAWAGLRARFGDGLRGVVVQQMVEPGREFLVGVASEPVFGPLVVFGLGGVDTDVVADRSHRLVPLTDRDAEAMIHDLRASAQLFGEHAEAPLDIAALEDVLLRTARMAELLPEVVEVDLNPVIVTGRGARIPDVRVRVQQREPDDPLARRLRV